MTTNAQPIVVELYSVLANVDTGFQRLNRVIRKNHYEIEIIPVSDFEKEFRHLFQLEPFDPNRHRQNAVVTFSQADGRTGSFCITEEFCQLLPKVFQLNSPFCTNGNFTLLKTKKLFQRPSGRQYPDPGIIQQSLEHFKKYTDQLTACLRLARYGSVRFDFHFARIAEQKKIFPFFSLNQGNDGAEPKTGTFMERDNALVAALMDTGNRDSGYLRVNMNYFNESFHIHHPQIRFLHLLRCLENCFGMNDTGSLAPFVARYSSILVAINKREFFSIYSELMGFFELKKKILSGEVIMETADSYALSFRENLRFLEEIVRNIIKKLLYMNIKSKEELFYKLDLKTLPG